MRDLPALELLDLWERGQSCAPAERDSAVIETLTGVQPGTLTIGARDRRMLEVREALFGPGMQALARCPSCGSALDLDMQADQFSAPAAESSGPYELTHEGWTVLFRLPEAADLYGLPPDLESAVGCLREECLLEAHRDGEAVQPAELPPEVLDTVERRMGELDPQGDIELLLECPACGHSWSCCLDAGSYFWTELEAWSRRTLAEVHELARAYGWTEDEILAMSPLRRSWYLEMVRG